MMSWGWTSYDACIRSVVALLAISSGVTFADPGVNVTPFAKAPELSLASLSPDGAAISFVEHSASRQTVVLRALDHPARDRHTLSVESSNERIRWCDWIHDQYVLCGTISEARRPERVVQKTRLFAIHSTSGEVRELNRRIDDPLKDQVIGTIAHSSRVLLQHDPIGRGYPEVAELDLASGAMRRVVRSHPPIRRWMSDGLGTVQLGIGFEGDEATLHVRREGAESWDVWIKQSLADVEAIGPLAIGAHRRLYVLKHYRGRAALFELDMNAAKPNPQLLFADPIFDVTGPVALDSQSGSALSVQYVHEQESQHPLQESAAQRIEWLREQLPGLANIIVDRSADGQRLLVRSSSDVDPPSLYLYEATTPSLTLIGHQYPALEELPLAPMQSIIYRARDGQRIPAYLTLPATKSEPLPAIILPHGGPETRNWKTFDALVQFLAAEGYAVLQMNFRGSFGYGAAFAAAGMGQWGGVVHNDITDGARWLVEQKIADPTRICIVGSSFGGYAALLGAARESQWYACAASYAGIADLLALSQHTQRLADADMWRQRLGEDSRALWQMSPMARVRAVETPVLLMHGRRDAVVPMSQSRRFARELRQADKEHRFVERADCDHEMNVQSCRLAFFTELRAFLAAALR